MDSSFTSDTNTIDGKNGVDVLDYSDYTVNGITVDLGNENDQEIVSGDFDAIKDVENLIGGTKNDTLTGSSINNSLDGNEGSDRFYGSNGIDTINGGVDSDGTLDTDVADYSKMTAKVVVTGSGTSYTVLKPDGNSDTLTNIEEVQGSDYKDTMIGDNSSSNDDIFRGGDNSDLLVGNLGADSLYGEEGDDTLRGGVGDDYLHGGTGGSDTADFSDATGSGIDVNLSQIGGQAVGGNLGTDTLVDIENAIGSDFADTITGNDDANIIKAGDENDTISGGTGADALYGEDGDDTFNFSATVGESTGDYINGGAGVDTADYSNLISNIELDLNEENNGSTYVKVGSNTLDHQIENVENIKGTAQNDNISGNSSQNTIDGGAGDDILNGEGGVDASNLDTLIGGLGNDTFIVNDTGYTVYDGETGQGTNFIDTVDFSKIANDSNDKVNVNLQDGTFTLNAATINETTFKGIEGAIGGAGDDTIVGTTTANTLIGGEGDDTLLGNGASSGIDYIDGGTGNETNGDFVSFNYAGANGVTVDLSNGSTQDINNDSVDDLQILNIENLEGSVGNDSLTGNASDNILKGLDGNDTFVSSAGDDTIYGGDESTDSNTYTDVVDYSAGSKVNVDLTKTTQQVTKTDGTDTLDGIEKIIGSGENDTLKGDAEENTFEGGAGSDTLEGGAGDDSLDGEADDDILRGGIGDDILVGGTHGTNGDTADYSLRDEAIYADLSNATPQIIVDTYDGASDADVTHEFVSTAGATKDEVDSITGIENITGGSNADTFIGNSDANTLKGGAGADTFIVNDTANVAGDYIDGGSETGGARGNDTVDYSALGTSESVNISLNDTAVANVTLSGTANHHKLIDVENIIGTKGTDTIEGDSANNILDGTSGTNDTLSYANSSNGVYVNLSDSQITTDISGDGSADGIIANTAKGVVDNSEIGVDTVTNFDDVVGGIGNDTIVGSSGSNTLTGGNGDDLLLGLDGADKFIGGLGNDTVSYLLDNLGVNVSLRDATGTDGWGNTDTYETINNITGSIYNDTIEGDAGTNTLDGAGGNNTLTYENVTVGGVTVNLSQEINDTGSDGTDTIKNFQNLIGSETQSDNLTGNNEVNTIKGLGGNDTIDGGTNSDELYGGSGNDTFKVTLGDGSDTIDGYKATLTDNNDDSNKDTVDFGAIDSGYHVEVDLQTSNNAVVTNGTTTDQTDTLSNIENIIGTSQNDIIIGNDEVNIIDGGAGDDQITGNGGADTLKGGTGADTFKGDNFAGDIIDGGTGADGTGDTVDYTDLNNKVTVTLAESGSYTEVDIGTSLADHKIANIENITGSSVGDVIVGNTQANTILGGAGDDTIDGGLGADHLDGGEANQNTLSYESISKSVRVDLGNNSAITDLDSDGFSYDGSGNNTDADDEQDTILNFKTAIGSTVGDTLIAGDSGNSLFGSDGEDTLISGAGADYLDGGLDSDRFILSADNQEDIIQGGSGTGSDTVDYSALSASNQITVTLNGSGISTVTINSDTADKIQDIENVMGTKGDDTITGDGSVNILEGNEGKDTLLGKAGEDTLRGGDNDDILKGGDDVDYLYGDDGDDTLDGGEGIDYLDGGTHTDGIGDFVSFSSESTKSLDLNLKEVDGSGYAQAKLDNVGDDYLKDIENITATNQNDTIVGNSSINTIVGLNGDDIITGDGGADILDGGKGDDIFKAGIYNTTTNLLEDGDDGADVIDGGTDSETNGDTVDYSVISKSINVTLADDADTDATVNITDYDNDTIRNIENITGSKVDDIISGNKEDNTLKGDAGDDTLYGAGGDDVLDGGDHTLGDTADYTLANTAITVDMSNTAWEVSDDGDSGKDNLIDIERIIGSTNNDIMSGSTSSASSDTFYGGAGSDTISGGLGADELKGYGLSTGTDSDLDTVSYSYVGSADEVTVDLSTGTGVVTVGADISDSDTLSGFENVIGGAGADNITGSDVANIIQGGDSNDTITGGLGADNLQGEAGQDTFIATSANDGIDAIDGGADKDTVDYSALGASNNITSLTLAETGNTATIAITGGDADTLTSIENVIGTQGSDTIVGNSQSNILKGGAGDDSLDGKGDDDSLYGEEGDDYLKGGTGDDYLDGGSNTAIGDTVDYSDAILAVTVDMSGSSVEVNANLGTDTLVDIENVKGSNYDDTFYSDINNANTFYGNSEVVVGDTVDYFNYANGLTDSDDKIVADMTSGTVELTDGGVVTVTDKLDGIENITGSAGDDTISGDGNKNTLKGLSGADVISGGAGNDILDGGDGDDDTVSYSYETINGVTVDLQNNTGIVNALNDSDTLSGFENVTGTNQNDKIIMASTGTLTAVANKIDGLNGTDTVSYENYNVDLTIDLSNSLVATGDNDYLTSIENVIGGIANDTFITNTSISNQFDGNSGSDTVDYSALSETINVTLNDSTPATVTLATSANDTVLNIENIKGGSANDTIIGDTQDNILTGNSGEDTLNGVDGDDTLYGGNDNDSLIGGAGLDSIEGEAGDDTIEGGSDNDIIYGDSSTDLAISGDDVIDAGTGNDTVYAGLGDDQVDGNDNDDLLVGDGGDDSISGGAGADTIYGDDEASSAGVVGNDELSGGLGNDKIYGGYGDDLIAGNAGDDILVGGAGNDTVDYRTATSGVTVDLGDDGSTAQDVGGGEGLDKITEIENVLGSKYDDTFYTDITANNTFDGGTDAGNEIDSGEVFGDTLDYSKDDRLNQSGDSVTVDLSTSTATATVVDVDGSTITDTLINIENIIGTSGNDIISGSDEVNTLKGMLGEDTLQGGDGNDILDGGANNDTATYTYAGSAVNVDLDGGTAEVNGTDKDTLIDIENIDGSSYGDTIIMKAGANPNIIDGKGNTGGTDTVSYEKYTSGVTVDLRDETSQDILGDTTDNDTLKNIENLIGGTGNDIFTGSDLINNSLSGGAGDDSFNVSTGNDYINGGSESDDSRGSDTVDYSSITDTDTNSATGGISVTLNSSTKVNLTVDSDNDGIFETSTDDKTDEIINIENVIGTQNDDTITGDIGVNTLTGDAGDDILDGGSDSDTLIGGAGNDTFKGGAGNYADVMYGGASDGTDSGNDTVDYSSSTASVTVNLNDVIGESVVAGATGYGKGIEQGLDSLFGIENVVGSTLSDSFVTKADEVNIIDGGDHGLDGDTIDYSSKATSIDVTLTGATLADVVVAGADNDDQIKNIENVIGSSVGDTIFGDDVVNTLDGDGGNDILSGGLGNDRLIGGTGNNTVSYEYATVSGVTVDLDAGTGTVNASDDDILSQIQNVIGTGLEDEITGSSVVNTLSGGDGNDTFYSSGESDTINGDGSTDTMDYSNSTGQKVSVDLSTTFAQVDAIAGDFSSPVYTDTLNSIENISGTSNDDTITGDGEANLLQGNDGKDTLDGAGGADVIDGGANDDLIIMSTKAEVAGDYVDGGTGFDTINYQGLTEGITINMQGVTDVSVTVGTDTNHHTFTGIENIIGTNHEDTITADGETNKIIGMEGDDTLSGSADNDVLYGGNEANDLTSSGKDILNGGAGDDTLYGGDELDKLYGGDGKDTLYGDAGSDTLEGEAGDDLIHGGADADTIKVGLGADTAYGEAGDDTFVFQRSDVDDDIIYGGDAGSDTGNDTVDYSKSFNGMVVTLGDNNTQGTAISADQGTDTLYGIENVIGSDTDVYADTITGNNLVNTLSGKAGDDTLYGKAGEDTLYGGDNNDELHGGTENDSISGDAGDDKIYGDEGADTLTGGAGDDTFIATNLNDGIDSIVGNSGSDTVDYSVIVDTDADIIATLAQTGDTTLDITGGDNDVINGIENIIGGSGDDTFTGSALANILNGGIGTDEVRYDYDNSTGVSVDLQNDTATENGGVVDTLTSIENILGSQYDDTFITATNETNIIDGGTSDDKGDTVDYSSRNNAIDVALTGSTLATVTIAGDTNYDQIKNIENVTGSTTDDTITGDNFVNTLLGMAGNDTLDGGGEADYISGGAGNDTIIGGTEADILFGNSGDDIFQGVGFTGDTIDGGDEVDTSRGSDTVDYSNLSVTTSGVNVTLNDATVSNITVDGTANDHTIVNIENVYGTSLADSIIGDDSTNTLLGNDGTDYIDGGAGNDYIEGGNNTGTETLKGGVGLDTIKGGAGVDYIEGGDDSDLLYGDEGNDTLDGGAGVDTLEGGDGDDTLIGGAGNDNLVGGNHTLSDDSQGSDNTDVKSGAGDTVDYSGESATVTASLKDFFAVGTSIGTDTFIGIENLIGTDIGGVGDVLKGDAGNNTLKGLNGNDTIYENGGDDFVEGGAGDDYIYGGAGDDTIDGDATTNSGNDTLDYTELSITDDSRTYNSQDITGISIDLSDVNGQYIHTSYGTDTITNIENIVGSSINDYIEGNDESNTLEGRAGNDYLVGGLGADRLIGGSEIDTADFTSQTASNNVVVDMTKSQTSGSEDTYRVENDGHGNKEFLDGVENIITGDGDDTIYGDSQANEISTGKGDDTIRGGENADVIDGGEDEDTVDFSDLAYGVTVDLDTDDDGSNDAAGTAVSNSKEDTLRNIENVIGTERADNITGDDKSNTLFGGADDDILRGLQGQDYIDGGDGSDTIDYSHASITDGLDIDLNRTQTDESTYRVQDDGFGNKEFIDKVENVIGTHLADTIIGDGKDNKFEGGLEDDILSGNAGTDILIGGEGADTFSGGAGDDFIYGNEEGTTSTDSSRDVVDYSGSGTGVKVNLSSTTSTILLSQETSTTLATQTSTGEGTDRLYDIQDIIGSNHADTLVGDDSANSIRGGAEADIIIGGAGADTLYGENDNDTILGGLDGDTIYGGDDTTDTGNDTVDYSYITDTSAINADLSRTNDEEIFQIGTPTNFDHVSGIENVTGTRNADIIKGSDDFDEVNILDGYKGNDTFYASKGVDSFIGGEGTDTIDFSNIDVNNAGENAIIVDLGLQQATDDGYQNGGTAVVDKIEGIEIVIGTNGDDQVRGSSVSNTIQGGAGDDTIYGIDGINVLQGGTDDDSIYGGVGVDTIEGGDGNDILQGGANDDTILGGAGDDEINKLEGAGDDSIDAGAGNDTVYSGNGSNIITGGDDIDTLSYEQITSSGITANLGSGASGDFGTVTISTDEDTLKDHFEIIKGSTKVDKIYGFDGTAETGVDYNDTLYGEGGNDTIWGGIGDDSLYGGGADDIIRGQAGNDYINGEGGTDTIDFTDADQGVIVYLNKTDASNVAVAHEVMEDGFGTKDDVVSIERVVGSIHNDIIKGTNSWNNISSGAGDDTIIATNGGDTINGGTHNAGAGGGDWLSFEALGTAVDAKLNDGSVTGGLGTTTIYNIENLKGTTLNDALYGDINDNSLDGNDGNDYLYGNEGNDYLLGGKGDDILRGGAGTDTYDGGEDEDRIDFFYTEASVDVDLSTSTVINDGYGNTESNSITDIENIGGTENYGDTLKGDDNDNKIYGYGGSDTLIGNGGVDTLIGDTGSDILKTGAGAEDVAFGGEGIDTLTGGLDGDVLYGDTISGANVEEDWIDYGSSSNGIIVDLSQTVVYDSANDSLDGNYSKVVSIDDSNDFDYIAQIENIKGTNQTDTLGGDSGKNSILAGGGDDTIYLSTSGNDYLDGGANGTYGDWLSLEYAYRGTIDLNSSDGGVGVSAYNLENILGRSSSARNETVWGTTGDNIFVMYDGSDHILGRAGDDIYDLGAGNDRASAGGGDDILIGGAGTDILDYRHYWSGQSITIVLQDTTFDTNDDGTTDTILTSDIVSKNIPLDLDTLDTGNHDFFEISRGSTEKDYIYKDGENSDFETFYLSTVKDIMVADNSANNITAYEGDDTVLGMGGNDILNGGNGADLIFGGDDNDNISGGDGDDRLYGDAGADDIDGGENNDTIHGGIGDDNLSGDGGDDTIYDEEGIDTINGGDDEDTVIFKNGTQGITVDLSTGNSTDAFNNAQTISNVENIVATNDDDIIVGENGVTNILYGKDGADTFTISTNETGKSDYIYGGDDTTDTSGDDKIILIDTDGTADDANSNIFLDPENDSSDYEITVDMSIDNNIEFITGGVSNSTKFYGIEHIDGSSKDDYIKADAEDNIINGGAGNDYIKGLGGADTIDLGDGDDIVEGGSGDDILTGGDGIDTLVYSNSLSSVTVNLESAISTGASIGTDTISEFENIVGSTSGDNLTGDDSATGNTIYGQGGADSIYGLAGDDDLYGGDANDYIDGGAGTDNLYGEDGDDTFVASSGADIIDGGADSDIVDYSTSSIGITVTLEDSGASTTLNHNISGAYADTLTNIEGIIGSKTVSNNLTGNDMNNILTGGDQTDTIKGISGNNILSGGAGNDTIFAGSGDDTIDGGSHTTGGDTLDYTEAGSTAVTVSLHAKTAIGYGNDSIENIENLTMGAGNDTVEGDIYSNTLKGGAGDDTLTYANATNGVTIDFDAGTVSGDGADNFTQFENFIGTTKADIFRKDTISADTIFVGMDAGVNSDGLDMADYSEVGAGVSTTVDVNGITVTIDDGTNDDVLTNFEWIILGTGDDVVTLNDIAGIDTIDGGGGVNSLIVDESIDDLSSITLLNFNSIIAKDGQTIIVDATQLDDETIELKTEGTGAIIITATSTTSDHDFDNITHTAGSTENITLQVDASVDLSSRDIEIVEKFDITNGTLTVLDDQINTKTASGAGNIIVQVDTNSSQDFANLSLTGTETIQFTGNSTFTGDFQNSNISVDGSVTLTTDASKVSTKTVSGAGTVAVTNLDTTLNADFTNVNPTTLNVDWTGTDTYVGNLTNVDSLIVTSGAMASDATILNEATAITNNGTLNITNLEAVSDIDLTKVTNNSTLNANWSGTDTFTGDLNNANLTVSSGTMTVDDSATINSASSIVVDGIMVANAVKINGDTISGAGTITVNNLDATPTMNFTNITTATVNTNWSGTATYTGNLTNVDALTVSSGTMTVADNILGTLATNGAGNIVVQVDTNSSQDFANLSLTGTETIQFTGNSTFTGDFQNSNISVDGSVTLTTTFDKLAGKTSGLSGAGNITLSDANIDATNVNSVANAIDGDVTATVTADTAANLNTNLANATPTDVLTLTVSDAATDANDLVALNSKTNQQIDVSTIVSTINGDASELIDIYVTNTGQYNGLGNETVIIDNTTTAADVDTIANRTSGAVTATIATAAVASTLAAITHVDTNDIITFTTNDTSADATDILALNAKVDTFGVDTITTITESSTNIGANAVNVTDAIAIVGNTHAVTITGAINATNANYILNEGVGGTAGVVTTTVTSDTAANLNINLANANSADELTLTLSDTTLTTADDLIALDNKTSVAVNASNVTTITDTYADLNTLYGLSGVSGLGNEAVTISDTTSASNVNNILNKTSGDVTATVTADTTANLNTNLANATSTDVLTLTTTGTTAIATNLTGLDSKTSVTVDATSVTTITGTGAEVAAIASADITTVANYVATLSGTSSLANVNTVTGDTAGIVTATLAANTAANLKAGLTNADANDALTLTANGATATAIDLNDLDGKTSLDITVDTTAVTGNFTDINTLYVTNKDNFTNLGDENVTINDATSSTNVDTIANATSGDVTATVEESDLATNLNSELSNTTASDDITVDYTSAGTLDFSNIDDIGAIDAINFANGTNEVQLDDLTEFGKFDDITVTDSDGTDDTISFGTTSVTGNLDFGNINGFENLELSSVNDDITLSGDEPENVYGLGGDDTFTLDYSHVSTFTTLDGGAGTDEIELQGTFAANNALFGTTDDYDHIETLDISNMTLNGADTDEIQFTGDLINEWTNNGSNNGSLTLQLKADQMENIGYTDSGSTYHNSVSDGSTYTLNNGAELTIEQVS